MHERKINYAFETRREEGIPSASFSYDGYKIADLAVRSLICEVDTTPKPGLVDRENNGAHTDMNHFLFLRSALALRNCFVQCADIGLTGTVSADELRRIGLAGEASMFEATGGVNTHKGLIFSLGIVCAACGRLLAQKITLDENAFDGAIRFEAEELRKSCAEIAMLLLCVDAAEAGAPRSGAVAGEEKTHGEEVRQITGISGVKGEALSGFETAFDVGLPVLREVLDRMGEMNEACVETLIHLLARTEDSNLVYRGGLEGLEFVRTRAKELLEQYGAELSFEEGLEAIRELDRECIERNLSPGGCADLLAITIMLHFIVK
ncbi:MAG: triphosphoribosyl-dephospho-CoA synthase [Firmicutes bacterium]|nr:triphosphoribosyl-dephospho-CoA synthase [Bacillota bacterium]